MFQTPHMPPLEMLLSFIRLFDIPLLGKAVFSAGGKIIEKLSWVLQTHSFGVIACFLRLLLVFKLCILFFK